MTEETPINNGETTKMAQPEIDHELRGRETTLSRAILLTPWLMEPGGSMPHSQGLSNNS